jgi:GAF domain-containing protein
LPLRVDAAQEETGQGPCLDAVFEQQTVRVSDLRRERRWPLFTARAADAGAGSMLSFQLYVEGDNLGALNLYAYEPDAFTDESEHVGLLFAAHAAVAFAGAQKQDHLLRAMTTRGIIGQAMGILMERYHLTGDRAFQLLVRVSQHNNRKLPDIAEELIRTGELRGHRR